MSHRKANNSRSVTLTTVLGPPVGTDSPAAIALDLADSFPPLAVLYIGGTYCVLCHAMAVVGGVMHHEPTCPWVRAVAWSAAHPRT